MVTAFRPAFIATTPAIINSKRPSLRLGLNVLAARSPLLLSMSICGHGIVLARLLSALSGRGDLLPTL
jgi:hypothetical protein